MKLLVLIALPLCVTAADFATDVAPIFQKRCVACHSGANAQAGLDLTSAGSTLKGGKSGRAVQPGASDRSLLIEKVMSGSMPPGGPKLNETEIRKLRGWIDAATPALAG